MKNFTYTMPVTKEIMPEDIYIIPGVLISIPKGWEAVDFRPPVVGDIFLGKGCFPPLQVLTYSDGETWSSPQTPRLILKKTREVISASTGVVVTVNDIYKREITIPEGYKFKDFRLPKRGDMFITTSNRIEKADQRDGYWCYPYIIVVKT